MERYLLSLSQRDNIDIETFMLDFKRRLKKSKIILLHGNCILIESMEKIAFIDNVLQEIDVVNEYVLAEIARGAVCEGRNSRMYLYPSRYEVHDTINS